MEFAPCTPLAILTDITLLDRIHLLTLVACIGAWMTLFDDLVSAQVALDTLHGHHQSVMEANLFLRPVTLYKRRSRSFAFSIMVATELTLSTSETLLIQSTSLVTCAFGLAFEELQSSPHCAPQPRRDYGMPQTFVHVQGRILLQISQRKTTVSSSSAHSNHSTTHHPCCA